MSEFGLDVNKLPQDVREKLAELDLELSEGKSKYLICFVYIIEGGVSRLHARVRPLAV